MVSGCSNLTSLTLPANLLIEIELPKIENYHWKDTNGIVRTTGITGLSIPMTYTRYADAPKPADPNPGTGNSGNTDTKENNIKASLPKGTVIVDEGTVGKYIVVKAVTDISASQPTVEYVGTTDKKKKTISIPDSITYNGVKYEVVSVKAKALKGNKKITSVKIASSVATIGASAFEGCSKLKSVTIGTGVKTIGKNTFKNCKKLTKITVKSKKLKSVGKNAFKGINAKCKIKVPKAKLKAYKKLLKGKGLPAKAKIVK